MADFPSSPSHGDTYTSGNLTFVYNSTKGVWDISTPLGIDISDLSDTNGLLSSGSGVITYYANVSDLPTSGNSNGDSAFVGANNRLYIFNGSGWYSVALLNETPTISSITDAGSNTTPFTLSTDGTATVITVTATDTEGDVITYNHSVSSGSLNGSTVTRNNNVFTVTPHASNSATFSLIFTAADGVNTATSAAQSFILSFNPLANLNPLWYLSFENNLTNSGSYSGSLSKVGSADIAYETTNAKIGSYSGDTGTSGTVNYDFPSNSLSTTTAKTWSMGMWVKANSITGTNYIFDGRLGATSGTRLYITSTQIASTIGNITYSVGTSNWHHIVLVSDNANTSSKIYVDGNLELSATTPKDLGPQARLFNLYVSSNSSTYSFNGLIDEFFVYDGVLTAQEVTNIYNATG
tara:strand:+ start:27 stop:1250 length:1224 start_codon:yes stop_codon:yes gene_type:complete